MRLRLSLALVAALAAHASAQITGVNFNEVVGYVQLADDDATFTRGYLNVFVDGSFDGDVTSGTLTLPGGDTLGGGVASTTSIRFDGDYASIADLNAAAPGGTYGVEITGGSLTGVTGTLGVPTPNFPNDVPRLVGDSYSRLRSVDPAQDITLALSTFTTEGGDAYVYLNDSNGTSPLNRFNLGDSLTIPAGTLQAGHDYNLFFAFYNRPVGSATFNGDLVNSYFSFYRTTSIDFSVQAVPEPASFVAFGLGAVGLLRRRRRA